MRLFASVVVAVLLAGSFQIAHAAPRRYLVCTEVPSWGEVLVEVEQFGGMAGAVSQCLHFWRGHPAGVHDDEQ